jgi:hypothetical protein
MNLIVPTTVALALLCNACVRAPRASANAPLATGSAIYDGAVVIEPAARRIDARWTIHAPRAAAGDSLVFLLNSTLAVSRVAGAQLKRYADTVVDGQRRITVHLANDASPNWTLEFAYAGVPTMPGDSINSIREDWVELGLDSFWLPIIADFAHAITGTVRLTMPKGWQVASSGDVRNGSPLRINASIPLIDIPLSAARTFRVTNAGAHQVFNVSASAEVVDRVTRATSACGEYLSTRYGGATPLAPLRIVLAPRTGPGYARKNYIMITPTSDMSPTGLTRFLCHEVAHFWSTGAISSGPDNWINEAFAEFVSARAVRSILGSAAFDTIVENWRSNSGSQPIWTGPTARRPGPAVSYRKAPYLLHRLEERIGQAVMDTLLVRYMTGPARTTPGIIDLVGRVAGDVERQWFDAEIRK